MSEQRRNRRSDKKESTTISNSEVQRLQAYQQLEQKRLMKRGFIWLMIVLVTIVVLLSLIASALYL